MPLSEDSLPKHPHTNGPDREHESTEPCSEEAKVWDLSRAQPRQVETSTLRLRLALSWLQCKISDRPSHMCFLLTEKNSLQTGVYHLRAEEGDARNRMECVLAGF
jgi:hypothetical protein